MEKSDPTLLLKQLILVKTAEQKAEGRLLKDQFQITYEILKPVNIIKSTLKEVIAGPDPNTSLIDSGLGYITGFLARKILIGKTNNPVTKLLGYILQKVVSGKVIKNADEIKSIGNVVLQKIINKQKIM
jgi:hypothetical protein